MTIDHLKWRPRQRPFNVLGEISAEIALESPRKWPRYSNRKLSLSDPIGLTCARENSTRAASELSYRARPSASWKDCWSDRARCWIAKSSERDSGLPTHTWTSSTASTPPCDGCAERWGTRPTLRGTSKRFIDGVNGLWGRRRPATRGGAPRRALGCDWPCSRFRRSRIRQSQTASPTG